MQGWSSDLPDLLQITRSPSSPVGCRAGLARSLSPFSRICKLWKKLRVLRDCAHQEPIQSSCCCSYIQMPVYNARFRSRTLLFGGKSCQYTKFICKQEPGHSFIEGCSSFTLSHHHAVSRTPRDTKLSNAVMSRGKTSANSLFGERAREDPGKGVSGPLSKYSSAVLNVSIDGCLDKDTGSCTGVRVGRLLLMAGIDT